MKTYIYLIITTCLLIEFFSFTLVFFNSYKSKKTFSDNLYKTIYLHPFFLKGSIEYGAFDPLITQRYIPNTSTGKLKINSHGFIGNGHNDNLLNTFPEKPENIFRVFMLGGSSLAGNAMKNDNSHTISAFLEKFLNNSSGSKNIRFQVLNYGISGGWSFSELRRFFAEIIHLEPDMIISLDGWNDSVRANFESDRNAVDVSILNWDQLSYLYFDFFNGFSSSTPPFLFTYTYYLINNSSAMKKIKLKNRKKIYSQHHMTSQTSYLKNKFSNLDFVLFKNLDAISSYSKNNQIYHLVYLQPYAEKNRKVIDSEQKILDDHHKISVINNGNLWKRKIYKEIMEKTYQNYEKNLISFKDKYKGEKLINGYDITNIFENVDKQVYLDAIHYNSTGNQIISKKIASDILFLLKE